MSEETTYNGKPLSAFNVWELGLIEQSLKMAEAKREEASRHHKFDKVNNKKAMNFPAPNHEFVKLKIAIEEEIRKKQNA